MEDGVQEAKVFDKMSKLNIEEGFAGCMELANGDDYISQFEELNYLDARYYGEISIGSSSPHISTALFDTRQFQSMGSFCQICYFSIACYFHSRYKAAKSTTYTKIGMSLNHFGNVVIDVCS